MIEEKGYYTKELCNNLFCRFSFGIAMDFIWQQTDFDRLFNYFGV